jgi:hypothetical protein
MKKHTFPKKTTPKDILKTIVDPTPEQMKEVSEAVIKQHPQRELAESPRHRHLARQIYQEMTPEDAIMAFVEHEDPRFRELARSLQDKNLKKRTLQYLYQRVGLTMVDMVDAFQKFHLHRAMIAMAKGMPVVAKGVVEDASPRKEFCPRCDGLGWVPEISKSDEEIQRVCPQCKGDKEIRVMGDKDSKKLLFESTGLIKQAPGVAIQQNFNVAPMETLVKMKPGLREMPLMPEEGGDEEESS